ncbi:MAG: cupin domain-containing protein [Draconibacterium sp.]
MASILKSNDRKFKEEANKIDPYRLMSDTSKGKKGVKPQNLNFDLRQLNPGQFSAPYHFHRYAEELFMILSGTMTLRSPEGLEVVGKGDLIFFEMGESGAHQFYNHSEKPCVYLDVRTFIGYDVCDYPDSNKILLTPSFEIFNKETAVRYFEGEENIIDKWEQLCDKKE